MSELSDELREILYRHFKDTCSHTIYENIDEAMIEINYAIVMDRQANEDISLSLEDIKF